MSHIFKMQEVLFYWSKVCYIARKSSQDRSYFCPHSGNHDEDVELEAAHTRWDIGNWKLFPRMELSEVGELAPGVVDVLAGIDGVGGSHSENSIDEEGCVAVTAVCSWALGAPVNGDDFLSIAGDWLKMWMILLKGWNH